MNLKKPAGALVPMCRHDDILSTQISDIQASDVNGDNANDNGSDDGNYYEVEDEECTPVTGKSYNVYQFWNYVDDYMQYIRTDFFEDSSADEKPAKIASYETFFIDLYLANSIPSFYYEALQVDLFNYRSGTKIPPLPKSDVLLPQWQTALHNSVLWS